MLLFAKTYQRRLVLLLHEIGEDYRKWMAVPFPLQLKYYPLMPMHLRHLGQHVMTRSKECVHAAPEYCVFQ
jgi:hypothetical protein